jgi:hypothetical protein
MARATLNDLCDEVRSLVVISESAFTVGDMTFWDNDQVQQVLERHRYDFDHEELLKVEKRIGSGSVEYYEYRSKHSWLEQTDGGTAIFIVEDSTGTDVGTANYTPEYKRGIITFATDTGGSTYYLTGRRYDIYGAAAEVAKQTANYYATAIDVSTDGHKLNRSQLRKHFMEVAREYEMKSEPQTWEYVVE